jgi:CHAT domain-containing protein
LTPFNFKARPAYGEQPWQPARYLAFVTTDKEPLQIFDLGEAAPLNRMIEEFRFAVTGDPTEREKRGLFYDQSPETDQLPDVAVGQQLRSALFNPLMPAIGDNHRLFLAPDGNLSRLPFEILPLNEDRRLIDDYQISYLNVGRELLRMGTRPDGQSTPPIVVADPDFDLTVTPNSNAQNVTEEAQLLPSRQSKDLRGLGLHFGRLPGTRTEGQQIAEKLGVSPFMAEAALEASLKNLASPKIVHIATHGFFLPDQERDKSGPDDGNQWGRLSHGFENPLLRSGLALAGINTWITHGDMLPTAEDGVLTAEDVVSLDLRNTELVVLSACETGLGEVQVGEGVFGLRRAFILAGAKTLVMSLWKVPDQQTQDLMIDFYHRILAGEPRAEALRQAQLAMKQKYPEPLYWGAFICQGDPGPLEETN